MTIAVLNSPFQIFTAINSSDKAYPVMKFHLSTQLNQWRRETPIQERVKVETRVKIPLLRWRKSNRLFGNKPNDKLPHLAVSVLTRKSSKNLFGSKWTNQNKVAFPKKSAYFTYNNVMYFFVNDRTKTQGTRLISE